MSAHISICPTCKQPIPMTGPKRVCADCQKPIERHDKFHFRTIAGKTEVAHRYCDNPEAYKPKNAPTQTKIPVP